MSSLLTHGTGIMEWTDTGLVLQLGRFRENDVWLRLLTGQRGLVTVFAFGGSRSRRRFCGCLDLLNSLRCRVKHTANGRYFSLQEAVLLQGPRRLRTATSSFGVMINAARFLETLGVTRDSSPSAFRLMQSLLAWLEAQEGEPPSLLPLFVRWRLVSDQGFAPVLERCGVCGRVLEGTAFFRVEEGNARCFDCNRQRLGLAVPPRVRETLIRVQRQEPAAWGAAAFSLEERRCCATLIDAFVQYHVGIAWEHGRFQRV